jgi:hypothetical protein
MEGTARQERELKAEGAIEAAQNPNSSVSASDAQKAMVDQARAGGAAAFTFNPDASPEEKAAQAKEVSEIITCRPANGHPTLTYCAASWCSATQEAQDCCSSHGC